MQVQLYGLLAEKANTDTLEMQATSTSDLLEKLKQYIPDLDQLSFAVAVNRIIIREEVALSGAEEIAVLPPFAGG